MKIALVSGVPLKDGGEGGVAYYARALAEELERAGVAVELWSKRGSGQTTDCAVPVLPLWRPGLFSWWHLILAVLRRKPDVLHIQHSMFLLGPGASGEISMLLLSFALMLLRVRVVVTCHDIPSLAQITPEYVRLHKYRYPTFVVALAARVLFYVISTCATAIIVHQEAFAQTLSGDYRVNRLKIFVVPLLPIPCQIVDKNKARSALGISEGERVALFFGFATGYKGIEPLLEAMHVVNSDGHPPVRLLLGAGMHPKLARTRHYEEYYERLRDLARATPGVSFLGFVPDELVDIYIDAMDVAILPYVQFQGMSGPLNQCASHEKPFLISTNIAQVIAGFSASVFEPKKDEIAASLRRFFDDEQYRESVQDECMRFARHVMDSGFLALTLKIYDQFDLGSGETKPPLAAKRATAPK